jgi:hypothetical protein
VHALRRAALTERPGYLDFAAEYTALIAESAAISYIRF